MLTLFLIQSCFAYYFKNLQITEKLGNMTLHITTTMAIRLTELKKIRLVSSISICTLGKVKTCNSSVLSNRSLSFHIAHHEAVMTASHLHRF